MQNDLVCRFLWAIFNVDFLIANGLELDSGPFKVLLVDALWFGKRLDRFHVAPFSGRDVEVGVAR
jgi:hypothetical protein